MAPLPVYRLLIVYPEEAVNNEVKKTLFPVLGILLLEITWASIYGTLSAGQAWMPVCAAHWSDRSQNSEGTRRADWPQNGFAYFCRFKSRSA